MVDGQFTRLDRVGDGNQLTETRQVYLKIVGQCRVQEFVVSLAGGWERERRGRRGGGGRGRGMKREKEGEEEREREREREREKGSKELVRQYV